MSDLDLAAQVDAAIDELDAITSRDPAAARAMHAVRLAAHTLRHHATPMAPTGRGDETAPQAGCRRPVA